MLIVIVQGHKIFFKFSIYLENALQNQPTQNILSLFTDILFSIYKLNNFNKENLYMVYTEYAQPICISQEPFAQTCCILDLTAHT